MINKGQITPTELSNRIKNHELWLKDPSKGKRFQAYNQDFIGMDFAGDLSKAIFELCDLTFTKWKNVRVDEVIFERCNFSHSELESVRNSPGKKLTIETCSFFRAKITGCQIYDARLTDVGFASATLTNFTINSSSSTDLSFRSAVWNYGGFVKGTINRANFENCKVSNIVVSDCKAYVWYAPKFDFSKVTVFKDTEFLACDFEEAQAEGLTFGQGRSNPLGIKSLGRSKFVGANLQNCFFEDIEVYGCDFSGASLSDANFSSVDLINAKFIGVDASPFTMTGCSAYKASFVEAKGNNWYLAGCELSRADFTNAEISSSQMKYCDLTGAKLFGVSVTKISFTGSELDGATWVDGQFCKVDSKGYCKL
ncbi:pentapeptide repeat-containing protein [Cognatishimia activa]|uniref:pentapeptide repeat-containing protein n=1 Tax=Cognatishimia activa TaxID=1715691 RepID=UPI00223146A5|nr:pentapeptide repeat-containing protein [Cognatishimia activa]UZD92126.1 pentapeptide repeat-containing protein [Cognatishimia activa]